MNPTRRQFALRSLIASAAIALDAFGPAPLRAQPLPLPSSKSYRRLAAGRRFDSSGALEVVEFFSYACPHCFELEGPLAAWSRRRAPGVAFVRVPVPFLLSSEVLMRSYYAFAALGTEASMTPVVFSAFHVKRQRIDSLDAVASLVKDAGGDPARFLAMANSFGISTRLQRARELVESDGIESTPTLVVNGEFVTSPVLAGGHPEALVVVDELLGMTRVAG